MSPYRESAKPIEPVIPEPKQPYWNDSRQFAAAGLTISSWLGIVALAGALGGRDLAGTALFTPFIIGGALLIAHWIRVLLGK